MSKFMDNDPVLSVFKRRIDDNDDDVFLIAAGKRGSTKSGSCITLGSKLDVNRQTHAQRFFLEPEYIPKNFKFLEGERLPRVIYLPSQLMRMLSNFKTYPIGNAILWDEAGVEGDARDFAKKKNKILKRTMQTMRSLRWFLMLTGVTLKDFDVGFERNAGFYLKCMGKTTLPTKDGDKPYGRTKLYNIDIDPTTGKKKYKFLFYRDQEGMTRVLSSYYYIPKPPAFLENPYKRYKKLFQTKLYRAYANELDDIESSFAFTEEAKDDLKIIDELMWEVRRRPHDYYDFNKRKFSLIAIEMNTVVKVDPKIAKKVWQLAELERGNGKIVLDEKPRLLAKPLVPPVPVERIVLDEKASAFINRFKSRFKIKPGTITRKTRRGIVTEPAPVAPKNKEIAETKS